MTSLQLEINGAAYSPSSPSYIYPMSCNPISQILSTTYNGISGYWTYWSSNNCIINGKSSTLINGATDTTFSTIPGVANTTVYTITFDPASVMPEGTYAAFIYIAAQGGTYGANGATRAITDYADKGNTIYEAYGGGGGGAGGGQTNVSSIPITTNSITFTLYPRGNNTPSTISNYVYNNNTVSVGYGQNGGNGTDGYAYYDYYSGFATIDTYGGNGGSGGAGGSGGTGGAVGTYYGSGGGNGGYFGTVYAFEFGGPYGSGGDEGGGGAVGIGQSPGVNGEPGVYCTNTPGYSNVTFPDSTVAKCCYGGIGGASEINGSIYAYGIPGDSSGTSDGYGTTNYLGTAGNNPEFMLMVFVQT
jgi:hypothetical protein